MGYGPTFLMVMSSRESKCKIKQTGYTTWVWLWTEVIICFTSRVSQGLPLQRRWSGCGSHGQSCPLESQNARLNRLDIQVGYMHNSQCHKLVFECCMCHVCSRFLLSFSHYLVCEIEDNQVWSDCHLLRECKGSIYMEERVGWLRNGTWIF